MTMPAHMDQHLPEEYGRPMDAPGGSAPYNGPVGRGPIARPGTAPGSRAHQAPVQQYQPPQERQQQFAAELPAEVDFDATPLASQHGFPPRGPSNHRQSDSVGDVYDAYFDDGRRNLSEYLTTQTNGFH
jgi:hypothetical protein